jgi:hypothetical protein
MFSLELATDAYTNHLYCVLEGSKGRARGQGNIEYTMEPNVAL